MIEGVVLYNGVNRYGMRHVHVIRGGRKVDVDAWLNHLGIWNDRLKLNEYLDEDTQMWHLHLFWMEEGKREEWVPFNKLQRDHYEIRNEG